MANRFVDATLRLVDKFSSPLSIRRDIVGKKGNGADYRNHGRFWKNGGHI